MNRLRRRPQIKEDLKNDDFIKNEEDLKMKTASKMKTTSKLETTSKMKKTTSKMKTTFKMKTTSNFLMTSHLNSHRTTDIKPEMLSAVQNGNGTPLDKYNIRSIAHTRTKRNDNIFMQRQLYIDEAHTALDILRFAVFLGCKLNCSRCCCLQ